MYKKKLVYLILISTAVRILAASILELGNDEVYYYTYALHLQKNYFDHPPAVAWLVRVFTGNLYLQQEVFIRLGSIVFAAIGTWLCFIIGKRIRNEATGWYAALLYTSSIYCSIIAGTFILPDSPQVVFWLASLLAMMHIVDAYQQNGKANYGQWLLFGSLAGICIMCKVHGIFLWAGLGMYMLFYNRKMFLHPGFYLAIIVTAIIISPIFIWNLENNFITWRYHSQRVEVRQFSLNTDGFIQAVLGQVFYNNPLNVGILIAAFIFYKNNKTLPADIYRLLLLTGVPIIVFVTGIALFRDVLPHWSGPGFLTLSFVGAAFIDMRIVNRQSAIGKRESAIVSRQSGIVNRESAIGNRKPPTGNVFLKIGLGLIVILIVAGILAIEYYPGTIGSKKEANLGDGDFTLDMYGWTQFGKDFAEWENAAVAGKELTPRLNIVCNKWFPAAHIKYYVSRLSKNNVVGVGNMNDLHQFVWLNHCQPQLAAGQDALCIIPSNYPANPQQAYSDYFDLIQPLHVFTSWRSGKAVRYFTVYLLKGYKGNDEARTYKVE